MAIECLEQGLFKLNIADGVATVTVNRPESRNAMLSMMWRDMGAVMGQLGGDPAVKVVVVRGEGRSFIAGADIKEFQDIAGNPQKSQQYLLWVEGAISSIESMDKPVIAMVNGPALGGGCELATACDLRYAADNALFGIPACRLGIVITFQDTQRLVRLVGPACAKEVLLTGKVFNAQEALRMGLANAVLPEVELEGFVYKLAGEMVNYAPLTLRAAKQFVRRSFLEPSPTPPIEGLRLSIGAFTSQDFQEGVRAYGEKRPPRFTGK